MKKIIICDQKFDIDCNALTNMQFRKKFNRGIFEDFAIIDNFLNLQVLITSGLKEKNPQITELEITREISRATINYIDEYIEAITRVAYICCYTANNQIGEYEDWLKTIKRINTNDKWIVEVTELAVNCFCGQEGF